jgi:hypothetical protein
MLTELFASTTDDDPRRSIVLLFLRALVGTRLRVEFFLFLFLHIIWRHFFMPNMFRYTSVPRNSNQPGYFSLLYCLHESRPRWRTAKLANRTESCVDDEDVGVRILAVVRVSACPYFRVVGYKKDTEPHHTSAFEIKSKGAKPAKPDNTTTTITDH